MIREAKYNIIGRYSEGVSVLGYVMQDLNSGHTELFNRKAVEELALGKRINNVTAQVYEGKVIMKGIDCKLSNLPSYDKTGTIICKQNKEEERTEDIIIVGRLVKGKNAIGYKIALRNNGDTVNSKYISREKAVELAKQGYITNARVQMCNGESVLRGVSCDLAKLPSVRQYA